MYTCESLPRWLSGKNKQRNKLASQTGDAGGKGSIAGSGRSPGEGDDNPPQDSCLGNTMDRGVGRAAVHEVTKSHTYMT